MPDLNERGLHFFGRISAANSHDMKNVLAIINENAGLLEDLINLAEKGAFLDPSRLRGISAKIQQYVAKADRIVKSINVFAHSLDRPQGPASIRQSLDALLILADRFVAMRQVGLRLTPGNDDVELPVAPFILLHLLWLCLESALETVETGDTINMTIEKKGRGTRVRFAPLKHMDACVVSQLKNGEERQSVRTALNHRLDIDLHTQALVLCFDSPTEA